MLCFLRFDYSKVAIRDSDADLIAFGRSFISNPDLVEGFANSWALNPPADMNV